jgi:translation elongation factor EF-G
MSEFTFGFLVRNTEQNQQFVKEIANTVLMKPLNSDWVVFNYEDWDVPQSILTLSKSTPVLLFHNAEDHGWGFEIFQNGEGISKLDISYEMEEEFIMKEFEKRNPDMDDYVEFLYMDPEGQEIYAKLKEELDLSGKVKEQFDSCDTNAFKLLSVEEEQIKELNTILNPSYLLSLEDIFELVEEFKSILNMEEMSWIRPDQPEWFFEN